MKRIKLHRLVEMVFLVVICVSLLACSKDEKEDEPSSGSAPETSNVYLFATELNTSLINAGLSDEQAKVISDGALLEAKPLIVEKISKSRSPQDEDISQIAPAIVRGAMKSILDAGLSGALTLTAIGVISGSPIQSLAGRVDALTEEQKRNLVQSIVKTSTGLLDDAGVDSGNITKTALRILYTAYNALVDSGITDTTNMLDDMKTAVKEGLSDITTVAGFDSESAANSIDSYESAVGAPAFSPSAGAVNSGTIVTISTTTESATIWYNTGDGTQADPTCTTGTSGNADTSSASVVIDSAQTIKAIACKTDWNDSSVALAAYTIAITVTAPNGGETWNEGEIRTITWNSTGGITTVNIELWIEGTKFSDIATGVANDLSYSWSITGLNCNSSQFLSRIKIIDANSLNAVFDESDADFILVPSC